MIKYYGLLQNFRQPDFFDAKTQANCLWFKCIGGTANKTLKNSRQCCRPKNLQAAEGIKKKQGFSTVDLQ